MHHVTFKRWFHSHTKIHFLAFLSLESSKFKNNFTFHLHKWPILNTHSSFQRWSIPLNKWHESFGILCKWFIGVDWFILQYCEKMWTWCEQTLSSKHDKVQMVLLVACCKPVGGAHGSSSSAPKIAPHWCLIIYLLISFFFLLTKKRSFTFLDILWCRVERCIFVNSKLKSNSSVIHFPL